jgi:hypothetical protein
MADINNMSPEEFFNKIKGVANITEQTEIGKLSQKEKLGMLNSGSQKTREGGNVKSLSTYAA